MELISVIVPVYKVEPYLNDCISSIVNQTYRNLEIILVDDGSPDNCGLMCDIWAAKDSRIRVIHKQNGGLSSARNAGLDIARGEYIGFVDSDDMIRPEMYEILLNALRGTTKKIACCHPGWNPQDNKTLIPVETRVVSVEDTLNEIFLKKVDTSVWCRLYHNTIWNMLRFPVGETNEDYPLLVPTTLLAEGMIHVPLELYFYRTTPNSITATYWKNNATILHKNLEKIHKQLREECPACLPAFRDFYIQNIYSQGLIMEKYKSELNADSLSVYRKCIRIMKKNWLFVISRKMLKLKHKILYTMVITHTLCPIYKLLGRL